MNESMNAQSLQKHSHYLYSGWYRQCSKLACSASIWYVCCYNLQGTVIEGTSEYFFFHFKSCKFDILECQKTAG